MAVRDKRMYVESDFDKDSRLIDRFFVIGAGLSGDKNLIKQAGIVDTLGGIAASVKDAVGKRIKEEGTIGAAATYLVPVLLRGPLRWISLLAYWFFDISIGSLLNKAFDMAKEILGTSGTFTDADAAKVADEVTSPIMVGASLEPLYELEKQGLLVAAMEGKLTKEAQRGRSVWGRLRNIFGTIGRGKSRILGGGLIRWLITAVLLGLSGILAIEGPSLASKLIGGTGAEMPAETKPGVASDENDGFWATMLPGSKPKSKPGAAKPNYNLPQKTPHTLTPGGRGEQYHVNQNNTHWYVRLLNNSIKETVLSWAITIYPELKNYVPEILKSRSFNTMVSRLGMTYDPVHSAEYLQILPNSGLHSWKDIVDHFAGDVAKKIKKA